MLIRMTTTNPFPTPLNVPPAPRAVLLPPGEVTIAKKVYQVCRSQAGKPLTIDQITAFLKGEATRAQVRGALINMGKTPSQNPHLHRVDRGLYLYDEQRPRTWFVNPNNAKGARRAASKRRRQAAARAAQITAVGPAVVEAKRPAEHVVPTSELRPVKDAVVMTDLEGNLFVVRVIPV